MLSVTDNLASDDYMQKISKVTSQVCRLNLANATSNEEIG